MVKIWQEEVTIPTYGIGEPDKNPMFFEKRVYQGSSGAVYPNPIIEKIFDEKKDTPWNGIFMENEYLKIMILPALGGRVQMAYDKIKKRHFVYYNSVIKPALVGLTGPWISGGIEFNWPQHHRPSTFEPTDYKLIKNKDGSATVWINEIERMYHTKGMAGFTLYPGKAYLEIKVKLFNSGALPQSFLWWANPAVKVNDHYQSVFPPDVHAVFDHGKRDVSSFPVATGTYYKIDYSKGVDISRYKNIPVPTSYMAINSKFDFIGGYEHDTKGGLLHVANHHVSPGKKQWTWGCGDFGKAWERNLTDDDGPYIELMTGVYTDNQPDFSWLQPHEEKQFTQYFMPYQELGVVKNATKNALLNVEKNGRDYKLAVHVTSVYNNAIIRIRVNNHVHMETRENLSPEQVFTKNISNQYFFGDQFIIEIFDQHDNLLVDYTPLDAKTPSLPEPAKSALSPKDIKSTELLYLNGLHLEQYRHATYNPEDYYREALRRDEGDARNNNALGLLLLRRGQFTKAENYFRVAINRLTTRNPNPYDGEPYYNLGVSLFYQGKTDEAYNAFYKSAWNDAWKDKAYFYLSRLDCTRKKYFLALEHVEKALSANNNNHGAHLLKALIYRKLNRQTDALKHIALSLGLDTFNTCLYFEQYLNYKLTDPTRAKKAIKTFKTLARNHVHNYIEFSLEYSRAGFHDESLQILESYAKQNSVDTIYPMIYYFAWYNASIIKSEKKADLYLQKAVAAKPDYCFPNRLEELVVLQKAVQHIPTDSKGYYYLGNLWYDKKQYDEAIYNWEKSKELDNTFPTVYRNLALAYFNKKKNPSKAKQAMEKAFELESKDARVLMELDQLYTKINLSPGERLKFLEKWPGIAESRDDLYLEKAKLYNLTGNPDRAKKMIDQRKFHPWEGGEGKVSGQYIFSRLQLAIRALKNKKYTQAYHLLEEAKTYPYHLGEGKLFGTRENDIHYYQGYAMKKLKNSEEARQLFVLATKGDTTPDPAMFYNDQPPDKIFYQGLAYRALGDEQNALSIFNKLVQYGEKHANDVVKIDYFAISLPNLLIFDDELNQKNKAHCLYMKGLGLLGLKKTKEARAHFSAVLALNKNHQGSIFHMKIDLNLLT